MKRKVAAIVLSAAMVMASLTGCGGSDDTAATTDAAVEETTDEAVEETADDSEAADGAMSEETWSVLQDNYAAMVDAYNAVTELYSSDEIAADADIEDVLVQAEDVITQMGEIDSESVTEADAETLNSAMLDILSALSAVVDGMAIAE